MLMAISPESSKSDYTFHHDIESTFSDQPSWSIMLSSPARLPSEIPRPLESEPVNLDFWASLAVLRFICAMTSPVVTDTDAFRDEPVLVRFRCVHHRLKGQDQS
jgi:hypothetical protein